MHKMVLIYKKALKKIKYKYFMKYHYITIKLQLREEIKSRNINSKLFHDYKRKQEIINQLQQQYFYKEGEKYTFFPIINNYIIKYKNPYFFNNKYSITETENNNTNMKHSLYTNSKNNFNKTFNINRLEKKRYNKSKIIKRVKVMNHNTNNNSKKYLIIPDNNNINNKTFQFNLIKKRKSNPNFLKRIKTEESLFKTNPREMTLKSIIQEENYKNKMNKKLTSHIMSKKDVNLLIDSVFNIDMNKTNNNYLNRIKTESSFLFSQDESNILSYKTNNNKLQTDSSSTYDNINFFLKKINPKKDHQKFGNYNNQKKEINKNIFNEKSDNSRIKIISLNLDKLKNKPDNKVIKKKIDFNNKKISQGKTKIMQLSPYKKINVVKNKSKIKTRNQNEILSNLKNANKKYININNRYISNYNKTQINHHETTQTSKKEIFKNISFEIKNQNRINDKKINNQINLIESSRNNENDLSFQSLSDSKVLEIANTYIDEPVDKTQISGILTHKKNQNQNS